MATVERGLRLHVFPFHAARGNRGALAAVMIAFFLYWGTAYRVTTSLESALACRTAFSGWKPFDSVNLCRFPLIGLFLT